MDAINFFVDNVKIHPMPALVINEQVDQCVLLAAIITFIVNVGGLFAPLVVTFGIIQ